MQHISFPSIGQFRDTIKQITSNARYHEVPVPVITFMGTVKLHGTNSGICRPVNGGVDDIWFQSRERIITPESDNAGFAIWAYNNRAWFNDLIDKLKSECTHPIADTDVIQVFGEWAGGNIQKGVGLNKLQKSFFIFAVRISETAESTDWESIDWVRQVVKTLPSVENIHVITKFSTWYVDIDFNDPKQVQNRLIELTIAVEDECPVAKSLTGESGIGEGIVWEAVKSSIPQVNISGLRFKVKGEKHSASKVKTLAEVDVEKVNSINEFVDKTVTPNRLQQGIDKLREMGLEVDVKNTGAYLKWVMSDVFKEELDVLAASGLTTKEVSGKMSNVARQFFMNHLNE